MIAPTTKDSYQEVDEMITIVNRTIAEARAVVARLKNKIELGDYREREEDA